MEIVKLIRGIAIALAVSAASAHAELITFDEFEWGAIPTGEEWIEQGIIFSTPDQNLRIGSTPGDLSQPSSLGADLNPGNDFSGGITMQFTEGRISTDLNFGIFNLPFQATAFDVAGNALHTIVGGGESFTQNFDFSGYAVNRVDITGTIYAIDDVSFTLSDPEQQAGMLFLMLPTNLGGSLNGESLLTLITLSTNPDGTIADTEWVIPDFGPISLTNTLLKNGQTPLSLFGGGNIIGASPHVYNDSPVPVDEDLQIAIVEGLLTIQNEPFAFMNYLVLQGLPPTDISQPGSAIEGLPPETLIGWFSMFDPNGGEDPTFQPRLTNAVFDGTVNILANSSSGEFEVFPHFDLGAISNIEIVFAEDPTTFDEPMPLMLDPQKITQVVLNPINPVPEPGSIVLMGLGLAIGAIVARRRRRN